MDIKNIKNSENSDDSGNAKHKCFIKKIFLPLLCFAGILVLSLFSAGCMLELDPSEPHTTRPPQGNEDADFPTLPPSSISYSRIGIDSADFVNIRNFLEQKDAEGVKNGTKLAVRCGREYFSGSFSDFEGCFIVGKNGRLAEVHLKDIELVGKIDLTCCETLRVFECSNTNITDINLSGIRRLKTVCVENSPVSELDISGCAAINDFVCRNTRISELDLKSNSTDLVADITDNYCTGISLSVLSNSSHTYMADISLVSEGSGSLGLQFGRKEADPEVNFDYVYFAYPAAGYEIDSWIDGNGKECSKGTRTLGYLEEENANLTAVFRKIRKGAPADEVEESILNGEVLPVNGGKALTADWKGMDIDLDADGFKDALRLACHNRDSYADDPLYVLYVNGERCYSWNESVKTRFFLASLDGSSIQLFIDTVIKTDDETPPDDGNDETPPDDDNAETPVPDDGGETPQPDDGAEPTPIPDEGGENPPAERETHSLSVHSYGIIIDPTTQRVLCDELRLTASCSMEEFVFCGSIREYLQMGYKCFVCSGDSVDLDGDGQNEIISKAYLYDLNNILKETRITVQTAAKSDLLHLPAENDKYILTYNNIAYRLNGTDGILITGGLTMEDKENGTKTKFIFRVEFKNGAFGLIEYHQKS